MSKPTERFDWIRKLARVALIASLGLISLIAIATVIGLVFASAQSELIANI